MQYLLPFTYSVIIFQERSLTTSATSTTVEEPDMETAGTTVSMTPTYPAPIKMFIVGCSTAHISMKGLNLEWNPLQFYPIPL